MHSIIDWLVTCVEVAGAALVVGGVAIAVIRIVRVPFMKDQPPLAAMQIRLGLGMSLALGLEFLLAGDILRTAVAPTFEEIGRLAAVAAIRTALNYFLCREFVEGQRQIDAINAVHLDERASGPPVAPFAAHPPTPRPAPHRAEACTPMSTRRHAPLGAALRAALKGPLWMPELTDDEPTGDGRPARRARPTR